LCVCVCVFTHQILPDVMLLDIFLSFSFLNTS